MDVFIPPLDAFVLVPILVLVLGGIGTSVAIELGICSAAVFSLSSFGGEGRGEEAVSLRVR